MTHNKKPASPLDDLTTAYRTLFVDLPLAEAKLWLGVGSEHEVLDAVWTEYDALSHLAAGAIDQLGRVAEWPEPKAEPEASESPNRETPAPRQPDHRCDQAA
jgi:hypothetical protein